MHINSTPYGNGDSTYQALGGFAGISRLVDEFYTIMDSEAAFQPIAVMHTESQALKREKLVYFLCGWTGGPENYASHFKRSISIPGAHAHLIVGEDERDQWLGCMAKALANCDYPPDLQHYLLSALSRPAEIIRRVSQQQHFGKQA